MFDAAEFQVVVTGAVEREREDGYVVGMKAEIDHGFELGSGQLRWHVDREPEPCRSPRPAPVVTHRERQIVAVDRLVVRDRFTWRIPGLHRQWDQVVVHGREHSLVQLTLNTSVDDLQVVVHDARLVSAAITLAA